MWRRMSSLYSFKFWFIAASSCLLLNLPLTFSSSSSSSFCLLVHCLLVLIIFLILLPASSSIATSSCLLLPPSHLPDSPHHVFSSIASSCVPCLFLSLARLALLPFSHLSCLSLDLPLPDYALPLPVSRSSCLFLYSRPLLPPASRCLSLVLPLPVFSSIGSSCLSLVVLPLPVSRSSSLFLICFF